MNLDDFVRIGHEHGFTSEVRLVTKDRPIVS